MQWHGLTQVLGLMLDKFAIVEESKGELWLGAIFVLFLVSVIFCFRWSGATSIRVAGIVESSGPINLGKMSGGTREIASVRLTNGALVSAPVVSGGPLTAGDTVTLLEEPKSIGVSAYQVVGKEQPHEP